MENSEISSDFNIVTKNNVINLWRKNFPQQIRDERCVSALEHRLNGETRKLSGKKNYDFDPENCQVLNGPKISINFLYS